MFKITPEAAEQVRKSLQGDAAGLSLRVAAVEMPDGGVDYRMGLDEPTPADITFECEGISIVIDKEGEELLRKATLDYVELEEGRYEFIFRDPRNPRHQG